MGSPPGAARSRPIKHRARDALDLADLRLSDFSMPRCCEASRSVGPSTMVCADLRKLVCAPGPRASRAPSVLIGSGGNEVWTAAYPAPIKEYGRRSVGCLKFESEMRTGEHLARFTLPLQGRVKEERMAACALRCGRSRLPVHGHDGAAG